MRLSDVIQTPLSPQDELAFQMWAKMTDAPITPDYDMRGYWLSGASGQDPTSHHYPDTYKTPLHKTFSDESVYATPDAPHWYGDVLIDKQGRVVADERIPSNKVFDLIDNQSSPYAVAGRARQWEKKNIPTASEEALQQPLVDPTMLAGIGGGFGLSRMLASLGLGALRSELPGANPYSVGAMMIPAPNILKLAQQVPRVGMLGDEMMSTAGQHILKTLEGAGILKHIPREDWEDVVYETIKHDTPDLKGMIGGRGKEAQAYENFSSLIRTMMKNSPANAQPYPYADVGRPLGLAALIQDVRQHLLGGAGGASMAGRNDSEGSR